MKRREFVVALGGAAVAVPVTAWAQRTKTVIGVLSPFSDAESTLLADFRAGLREYGYFDGQNLSIEYRSAEGQVELLPDLVLDILRRNPDVIVTSSVPAIQAARRATSKTPIVFARVGDAINQGIVASLAHPGGNITGISWFAPELSGKVLGILQEAFPSMSHVAIFREAAAGAASAIAVDSAARRLGLKATIFQARTPDELEVAFSAMVDAQVDSLVVLEGVMIFNNAKVIAALALRHRLPAIFFDPRFVEAGGLLSYGPNFTEMHRRAAYFVDRILKGSNPGDLPVEQPTKFDLAVNLATANKWGLTIPPGLLLRADRIVE
jgi:putative tryptophan/tyrosine transport system substrate-binding protein